MTLWLTHIYALSPLDGQKRLYFGPYIPGETREDAQEYCENNGLGYLWVTDQMIVSEIPEVNGKPDWKNRKDY